MSWAAPVRSLPIFVAVATLGFLTLEPATAQAAAPTPMGEILRRAGEVLDDPSYQTELPGRETGLEGVGADQGNDADRRTWGDAISSLRFPFTLAGDLLARVLLWTLVAIVLATAAVWLLREAARGRLRHARLAAPQKLQAPDDRTRRAAPPGLDEVEGLARQGAYGEAVHLLLRRAIALIARRRPLSPSLTCREVPRAAGLQPPVRGAFDELARSAERFWFGGARLRREDYERSAAAYETVAGAAEGER